MKTKIEQDHRPIKPSEFRRYRKRLAQYIESEYGIRCAERRVVDAPAYYGSYNGRLILTRKDIGEDHKLFLVAHLFGHCVQYCGEEKNQIAGTLSTAPFNGQLPETVRNYEYEAARYAVALLQRALPEGLMQWFADWSHADWAYFSTLQSLNDKARAPAIQIICGMPLITGKEIPSLSLTEFIPRYAY